MSEIWLTEAARLGDGSIGGAMDYPSAPARVVWHTTESGAGDAAFNAVAKVLINNATEPHFLYDPTTDRIGQFGPMSESARALRNDGSTRTNRVGKACIQIEVLGRAGKPFTGYWTPGKNFKALMRAIRSWGIPDVFPAGSLATSYADADNRPRTTWMTKGGHYGHCNIPGNDHWDPGNIDKSKLFAAAPVTVTAPVTSKPVTKPVVDLSNVVEAAKKDPKLAQGKTTHKADVLLVEKALVAEKLLASTYADGSFGTKTVAAYKAWQKSKAGGSYSGSAADGIPGKASLTKLGARHGFTVKA